MSEHDAKLVQPLRELISAAELTLTDCVWARVEHNDKMHNALSSAREALGKVEQLKQQESDVAAAAKRGYHS